MLCATVVKMLYSDLDDTIRVVDVTRARRSGDQTRKGGKHFIIPTLHIEEAETI